MGESGALKEDAKPGLLLVDDDPLIRDSMSFLLRPLFDVHLAETRREASEALHDLQPQPSIALVDLGLPPKPHDPSEGFALISDLLASNPSVKVLVLSGQSEPANLRHAMALGAADFISKPCDPDLLKSRLQHQLVLLEAEQDATVEKETALAGESAAMESLRTQIQQFANAPFPVLIEGESGTGKELIAKQLHLECNRAHEPYIAVNCAAFSSELLESQLFGHAKGSFTGASRDHSGFFQEAGTGTLFLDEIGEMPLQLQSKLLRVIENGEYYRVGETKPRYSQVRLVAASNRELTGEVRAGKFRQDLYYRLSILAIQAPPLRERGEDRLHLLEHFQQVYSGSVPPFSLDEAASEAWLNYDFPGNVRELRNIVIRLGTKFPGQVIDRERLEDEFEKLAWNDNQAAPEVDVEAVLKAGDFDLDAHIQHIEWEYIQGALNLCDGNLSKASKLLKVNRTTLYSKIQRLEQGREDD
ncbi:MAG: sigma-54 dependent transcriptional regulator [Gammaproteobacteria bacterium]|nr:sigma-54 dependent transcriptional regulator [Gammaproteobacteria bacterium]